MHFIKHVTRRVKAIHTGVIIITIPQKIISIVLGAGQLQLLISAGFHSISYNKKKIQTQLLHTQRHPT